MILIIRGHIRDSFKTKELYTLIKKIHQLFPDLKIFIHTWNIFSNNISWRKINTSYKNVTNKIIYDYFDDLKPLIKHIIIDDDTKIDLIGNLSGKINSSLMPVIGWKNYWYGKYKIIDYLYNTDIDKNEMVVNCRFDVLNNSNSFTENTIINFIKNNSKTVFTKNVFLFGDENHLGIDNIYIGNIETMHLLGKQFFYELDDILLKNSDIQYQEKLVFRINSVLFDGKRDGFIDGRLNVESYIEYVYKNIIMTNIIFYILFGIPCVYIIGLIIRLIMNNIYGILYKKKFVKNSYPSQ
jgi:hypothetical protein